MIFLAFVIAIAASVWGVIVLRHQPRVALPTTVLLAGIVFGPDFFAINGPIQVSIDRILWVMMLAYLAVQLRLGHITLPKLSRTDVALALGVVWLLASCTRGDDVPDGSSPLARWIFYIAMPFGTYVAFRGLDLRERDCYWFAQAFHLLGVYLSITAVLEVTNLHAFIFPRHIVDPTVWEFYGRGRGPILNPAGNGMLITVALVVAAVQFFQSHGRAKLIYLCSSAVLIIGVYATLTRSVWLGASFALVLVSLVYTPRWVRVIGLASMILLVAASAFGLKDEVLALKRDKHVSASDAAKSVELRPLLAAVAWEMIKDQPLIGHGFGRYKEHSPPYHQANPNGQRLELARPYVQHNVFLSIAVDTGLIGGALLGACLISCIGFGWTLSLENRGTPAEKLTAFLAIGFFAAYVVNGLFHDVSIIPMMHMVLAAFAGTIVSLKQRYPSFEDATRSSRATQYSPALAGQPGRRPNPS